MVLSNTSSLQKESDTFPCSLMLIHPTSQIIIIIFMIPTCLTAILANLLVIISVWRTSSLHSPPNILLVGLAFSDLAVGLATQPAFIISTVAKITQQEFLFCKAYGVASVSGHCLCVVSFLTLAAISLDRYIAIHAHLRYPEIVTMKRVRAVLIIIWIIGSIHSLLNGLKVSITQYLTSFLGFMSFAIIIFASCSIYRVVRRHQTQIAAQMQVQTEHTEGSSLNLPQFKRSFINMQILCWILLLCYLPYLIVFGIILATGLTPSKQATLDFSALLVHFNSTLNLFLYSWRCQPIRAALTKLVRDIFCNNSPQ